VEAAGFRPVAALPIVTIGEGTRAEDLKLLMHALGSISGRAVDLDGKPLPFAHVEAMVYQSALSFELGSFRTISGADADDRGGFRLSDLGSNEYLIRIRPASQLAGNPYPPTYFPGTADPNRAEKIRLAAGAHIDGIELKLSTQGVHVAGRFVTDGGKAVPAMAYLVRRTAAIPVADSNFSSDSRAEQFDIATVPPGSYWLYAVTDLDTTKKTTSNNPHSPQWVRIPIEIGDRDLRGVLVPIRQAGSLHVHVRFSDDSTNQETASFSANAFHLSSREGRPPVNWNPSAQDIGPGQFEYVHFSEINCFFGFLSDEWFISKLMLEGHDVTSSGFSSAPGEERLLEVIVSNAGGAITGRITDVDGKPAADSRVVLLASPQLRANPAFGKLAVASDTGEFRIQAIAPGEYIIMAFSAEEQPTPQNYERFERFGQNVQIGANVESKVHLVAIPTDAK
jgi:hypothetical protein